MELRASYMLGKHSMNWTSFPSKKYLFRVLFQISVIFFLLLKATKTSISSEKPLWDNMCTCKIWTLARFSRIAYAVPGRCGRGQRVGTALGQWDRRLLLRALGKVMLVFWRLTLSPWHHLGISRRNWKGSSSGALGSLHKQWMASCLSYLLLYLEKMYWVVYKEHKLIFSRSRHQCLAL